VLSLDTQKLSYNNNQIKQREKMVFTNDFEKYGVKFKIKMLTIKEAEELQADATKLQEGKADEDTMFKIIMKLVLDEKFKPMFNNIDEVKNTIPPKVIEEIITLATGN
jgi:hypothetical protein